MSSPKIALLVLWVVCFAALWLPGDSLWLLAARGVFWILVVVHAAECIVFLGRMRQAPGSLGHHLVQTFLFGFVHLRTLP